VRRKAVAQVAAMAASLAVVAACGSSSKASSPPSTSSAAAGGGSSASAPAGAPSGTPIKIGQIGVFSGFSSQTSLPGEYGLEAWVSYTNANGGINGHPVQLITKDDAGVPAKSLAAAKELIQNDHVVAIVGQNESGLEDVWSPYAASQKVPVIGGPANGGSWLTNSNNFPAAGTVLNTEALTANGAKLDGKSKYSVVYCAEVPACAQTGVLGKAAAKQIGIGFAGYAAVSASATSYTSQCLQLKDAGADSVFSASSIDVALRFFANCTSQGFSPTPINDPRNWSAAQAKNPIWNNAILTSEGPLWFGSDPAIQTYLTAMAKYQPNSIGNSNGPLGWAAGYVFGAAAKAGITASDTPSGAGVLKGLYTLGPDYTAGGLIPPTTYTPGKPATQKACGWYAKVVNGAVTTPFGTGQVCISS
jgi:branched-chain amino acid transport system substrate-binding protein